MVTLILIVLGLVLLAFIFKGLWGLIGGILYNLKEIFFGDTIGGCCGCLTLGGLVIGTIIVLGIMFI